MPREMSFQAGVLGQAFGEGAGQSLLPLQPLALEVVPVRETATLGQGLECGAGLRA